MQAGSSDVINEPIIQWGALSLFGSVILGWISIAVVHDWRERRRRRYARGFRAMKSPAQVQRERAQRARWGNSDARLRD
jgi:peptidoglycan/LPS O-acetylase OafA/YrhL